MTAHDTHNRRRGGARHRLLWRGGRATGDVVQSIGEDRAAGVAINMMIGQRRDATDYSEHRERRTIDNKQVMCSVYKESPTRRSAIVARRSM